MADYTPGIAFQDSFTDADDTLLENHQPDIGVRWQFGNAQIPPDGPYIINNTMQMKPQYGVAEWLAVPAQGHLNAKRIIRAITHTVDDPSITNAFNGAAILFRGTDPTMEYRWSFGAGRTYIALQLTKSSGSSTTSYNYTLGSNVDVTRTLRVELTRDRVQCYADDVLMFDFTDDINGYKSGYDGARIWNNGGVVSGWMDDYEIEYLPK